MKHSFWKTSGIPGRGMGLFLSAFCLFIPLSHAVVVLNNTVTGSGSLTGLYYGGNQIAQPFTMPGSSIDGLTLQLQSTTVGSTAEVDLFSGDLSTQLATLGTVTIGTTGDGQLVPVSSFSVSSLVPNTQYAIVLQLPSSGSMAWDYINNSASGGVGSFSAPLQYYSGGTWNSAPGYYFQLNLNGGLVPVPEVSITGVAMSIFALAIALGCILRRRSCSSVSNTV